MKRRLVLHLGLWKTGTTTIQRFLRKNPNVLAEAGVFYPKVAPENPDHPFFRFRPATIFLAEEVSHQFLAQELAGWDPSSRADIPLWSTAFRQIDESGAHTAIISYEDFSARVTRYKFDAITNLLKNFDVIGIIYLRSQESWAVSLYSHLVRGGRTALSFREFMVSIRQRLIYSELLDQIRSHVPLNKLLVRNFEDAAATGLVEDFFSSLDLQTAREHLCTSYVVKNKSLPHWAVHFLKECDRASLPVEALRDIRKAVVRSVVRDGPSLPLEPGLDLAAPDERSDLRAMTIMDAERLAEKYGIRFTPTESVTTPYRPFDRRDFDAVKNMIVPKLAARTRGALTRL